MIASSGSLNNTTQKGRKMIIADQPIEIAVKMQEIRNLCKDHFGRKYKILVSDFIDMIKIESKKINEERPTRVAMAIMGQLKVRFKNPELAEMMVISALVEGLENNKF